MAHSATHVDTSIGQRVRSARLAAGLSQYDAAVDGASYSYISRVEADERTPSVGVVIALAAKFDVSPLWLLTGDEHHPCPLCGSTSNGGTDVDHRNGNTSKH